MLKWKVWSQIYLCDIIITGPCAHANCLQVRARTPASRAPHVRLTCTTTRMANFIVMALWDEMVAMGLSSQGRSSSRKHTVAIWTFTFHKISGFVWVILKANFKEFCRPKVSIFWSENSDLLFSFSFFFCQICQIHWFLHLIAVQTS